MLQIVSKMYFRPGVPLHETVHRDVLYTNCTFLRDGQVELPVGVLAPSTAASAVSTVTVCVTEYLEAQDLDGERSGLVATGGLELIDDLSVVLSFGLNAVFSRNRDLVRRLVPDSIGTDRTTQASRLFGQTFEPHRYVPELEREQLRDLMKQLLALRRPQYEAAMRAIRRIVGATQRAADDPTLAYVDIVAALESLSAGVEGALLSWDRLDGRKRKLLDVALQPLDQQPAERVRTAIMEAERLGIKARFATFVTNSVSPDFYRSEAAGRANPIRAVDLERLVKLAYDIRSQSVHSLRDLQPEAWIIGSGSETIQPAGGDRILTHSGLARLAWHVVRRYIADAPRGVDPQFDWRANLPGQLRMEFAPEYWVANAYGFSQQSVGKYFTGFVQLVVSTMAGRPILPDIRPLLERIEQLIPAIADDSARRLMLAVYSLWHRIMVAELHREEAAAFLLEHQSLLQAPSMAAFVTGLLLGQLPEWTVDEWETLARERLAERSQRKHLGLPATLDAALQVIAAQQLLEAGRIAEAEQHAAAAVEELPGSEPLMGWERSLRAGEPEEIDPWVLAVQPQPPADDAQSPSVAANEETASKNVTPDE